MRYKALRYATLAVLVGCHRGTSGSPRAATVLVEPLQGVYHPADLVGLKISNRTRHVIFNDRCAGALAWRDSAGRWSLDRGMSRVCLESPKELVRIAPGAIAFDTLPLHSNAPSATWIAFLGLRDASGMYVDSAQRTSRHFVVRPRLVARDS